MGSKIDTALKIYDAVNNALVATGIPVKTAAKYSYFASELYNYIEGNPQLQTVLKGAKATYEGASGAKQVQLLTRLESSAGTMGFAKFAERFGTARNVAAGGVVTAFVDYFATIATQLGIEMNECALAITKVMLDVLTTYALVQSVVGVWAGALQLLSTAADGREAYKACITP